MLCFLKNRNLAMAPPLSALALVSVLAVSIISNSAVADGPEGAQGASPATQLSSTFKDAIKEVGPCVVHITTIDKVQPAMLPHHDLDLRQFFGEHMPFRDMPEQRFGPPRPGGEVEKRGLGTGVIVREDGILITNNHVAADADALIVRLEDGREFEGKIIGSDADTDLAVIQIDVAGLPAATFGDSDALEPGDWVLAVGNPFGLDHTVTSGIVSAKGRGGMGLAQFENFIQTDAAINPGNSGGPLVNLRGEIVGINTAITTRSGGSLGIGFAIPSNMALRVVDDILDHGKVDRGWLGVSIQKLSADLAQSFGFNGKGVVISTVLDGTPAAEAGLQAGDIVTDVNGKKVTTPSQLMNAVAAFEPGETVGIQLFRDGQFKDQQIRLGERPAAAGSGQPAGSPAEVRFGLQVQELNPELARRFNTDQTGGVIVSAVQPAGPASIAGIRPGDLVLQVDSTAIKSMADFDAAIAKADADKKVRMLMQRGSGKTFVVLRPTTDQ